ncbi:hypothetical protein Vretifemale_20967 [Volvox reticuliferus]|uniref:K Homology domain-containing protein n=1 Tax=Volvox reticuliferus TaxID=1737510 RepID=A0A8J4G0G5_9CHLO|nr:hypothetical protein Vretifemale_20967 [Volvox reticuliferus]
MQQQQPGGAGRRQTAVVTCPKSMIGRVIGRNGETIKALQTYTGALIQIDQTCDPTKIAISGTPQSLSLALSMVHDIVRGTFKGFALLRQATGHSSRGPNQLATNKPVYAPGYGLIPPSQVRPHIGWTAGRAVFNKSNIASNPRTNPRTYLRRRMPWIDRWRFIISIHPCIVCVAN